jgi:hypothetical protein
VIFDDPAIFDLVGAPDSPLGRPIAVTLFADRRSQKAQKRSRSLIDLAGEVGRHKAATKDALPYVKLAKFGGKRTAKGALRSNDNLESVTGIEADYDAGTLSPAEAAQALAGAGIAALIYTSPSHGQPGKGHRFRILAPCAEEHPPEARAALVARLNGVLGGVLAPESFTKAQGFTFGHALDRDPPQTILVDGRCIDQAPDLDARAIGKPTGGNTLSGEPLEAVDQSDDPEAVEWAEGRLEDAAERVADAPEGERNATLNRAAFTMGGLVACRLLDPGEVESALVAAADVCGYISDYSEAEAVRIIRAGLQAGAARPSPYAPVATDFDDDPVEDQPTVDTGLRFLSPGECAAMPPRDYIVKGLIGPGQVGCIFGEPGAGKSVIAPRLAYAVAQGEEIFGLRTRTGGVFYVACEDESGMAERITALHNEFGEAPGFRLVTGVSDLFSTGKTKGKGSPHLEALRRAVKTESPRLILIDTLAMAMPGLEENDAAGMARVVAIGRALARYGAAVILIHHGTKAEGSTPRGHSVFNGALDFSLQVKTADQSGIVRGMIRKNRNGPPALDIAFRIGSRHVGQDVDGEPVTAPFCEPCSPRDGEPELRLSAAQKAALGHMLDMMGEALEVRETEWRKAAIDSFAVSASEDRDNRRRAVTRALQGLIQAGHVEVTDGLIRITGQMPPFEDEPEAEENEAD